MKSFPPSFGRSCGPDNAGGYLRSGCGVCLDTSGGCAGDVFPRTNVFLAECVVATLFLAVSFVKYQDGNDGPKRGEPWTDGGGGALLHWNCGDYFGSKRTGSSGVSDLRRFRNLLLRLAVSAALRKSARARLCKTNIEKDIS